MSILKNIVCQGIALFSLVASAKTHLIAPLGDEIWRGGAQSAAMPLLVSSAGRYLWSDKPFAHSLSNGFLRVDGTSQIECVQAGKTLREAYLAAMRAHFPFDGATPPAEFFTRPMFNTAAEMAVRTLNEKNVNDYTREIFTNHFPCGVYILSGDWFTYMGSMRFDCERFPNPRGVLELIREQGCKSLLWASPLVSPDSREYRELSRNAPARGGDFLLSSANARRPAILNWAGGMSAAWDLTHPAVYGHWISRLDDFLEKHPLDGWLFAGADADIMADCAFTPPAADGDDYMRAYGRLGKHFAYNVYHSLCRQGGKARVLSLCGRRAAWEDLPRLISDLTNAGLMGYPYCSAGVIGGGDEAFSPPGDIAVDQKLFVRTCAMQALLPVMQFSLAPWRVLSKENCAYCREFVRLRLRLGAYIAKLAQNAAKTGEPIVRAMDYEFPNQGFNRPMNQFMLGPKYLVSPVITRDDSVTIAFPAGKWRDARGMIVEGPRELKLEKVPLDFLPYFEKL